MAAYAALVSVMQILDQLQVTSPPPISIDKTQLQFLTQKLAFLQEFLEGYSSHVGYTEEADPMASRIADAAYAAEDVIESHIVDRMLARSTNHREGEEISSMEFYQSLQTVIEKMELIEVEAMEIKQKKGVRDQLHMIRPATDSGSSVRVAPKSPITVGFDDVLCQMLGKITRGRLDRQIIPIVGMGGIDAEDIVVLRDLHTLSIVRNLIFGEEVISRIPNIKKLKLYYDDEFLEGSLGLNNLRHLHKLETLAIGLDSSCDSRLVRNISFPHSLKWLKLQWTKLQWEDVNTKIGPLPLLQVLKLKWDSFIGSKWETLEGQFCSLKFLLIDECDLEQWVTDYTHFPRLQHLVLRNMRGLREIPSSMGDIPTLQSIELNNCSESAVDSAKRIQEEQEDYGNTDLKLIIKRVFD